MAQSFPETYFPDLTKYSAGYDHIFNKAKCPCEECEELRRPKEENKE